MKIFRNRTITRILTFLTGAMFLAMSFFLAGASLLNLQNEQMIENVSKIVLNEEEKDAAAPGTDVPLKEVLPWLNDSILLRHTSLFLIAERQHHDAEDLFLHAGHAENFSPPPEFI